MSGGRGRWKVAAAAVGVVAIGVVAFLAYGGLGPSGTPRHRLTVWVEASRLGQVVGTLEADAARVTTAVADHRDARVMHTICGVLLTDAQSANGDLPTADGGLTNTLARAYELEYEAGNDCYSAGSTNTELLNRSAVERREAATQFSRALDRVEQVTGRPLSTTTTTEPGGGGVFG